MPESSGSVIAPQPHVSQLTDHAAILIAFARTKQEIKLLSPDGKLQRLLTATEACVMLNRSKHDVFGSEKRIKALRQVSPRVTRPWEACYRNTSAPVLQPSIEWLRGHAGPF